jgi:hypothetical protein
MPRGILADTSGRSLETLLTVPYSLARSVAVFLGRKIFYLTTKKDVKLQRNTGGFCA